MSKILEWIGLATVAAFTVLVLALGIIKLAVALANPVIFLLICAATWYFLKFIGKNH